MKQFSLLILSLLCSFSLLAQKTTLRGTILSSRTGEPLEFAKILLVNPADQQPAAGTTSDAKGRFSVETTLPSVDLEISFIGHEAKKLSAITLDKNSVDLGTIKLTEQATVLDEVTIAGEKSSTEFQLDKRVFNVGQDLSSTGASALDVLNNVPSVNVSIEGNISLRGSEGVQILIDGKPSVLASEGGNALGTITADMIDKIEVITNPSAKYDAEGTAGILNIVLKKEEKKGLNGSVSVNTGYPASHSVGVSLNRRTQKFNLFSQMGVGYRSLPDTYETINQNFKTGTTIRSDGLGYRNETFYNLILGAD
ncbi:MAG: TonB-dependent receptor, partial [Bacteroidota bacterium]